MKKNFLAVAAVILAVAASAFTTVKNASHPLRTDYAYYEYSGSTTSGENDAENWNYIEGQVPANVSCTGENVLCTISAPQGVDNHPDFSGIGDVSESSLILEKRFKP